MRAGRWAAVAAAGALAAGCAADGGQPLFTGPSGFPPVAVVPADLAGIGDPYFPTYGNGGYDVGSYDLKIKYDPATDTLTGTTTVTATAKQALKVFHLDLHKLTVDSVTVDGQKAQAERQGDELVITPPAEVGAGKTFVTVVQYGGVPQPITGPDLGTTGFLHTGDGAFVIGEPESATTWFPVNDHPKDKATYTIEVTAPERLKVISNGVLAKKTPAAGWTSWQWKVNQPMAPYLATVVIGDYRVVEGTHKGKPVMTAVASSLPPGAIDAAVARTTEVTDFLEQSFGPYPFDAYGGIVVSDDRISFALETQTRPVYSDAFWTRGPNTWVIAHELAHQWYGDSLSVEAWQHIWLNEGFATYAQWMWGEHEGDATVQSQFDQRYADRQSGLWEVAPGAPGSKEIFSASVYQRGAMTLHRLRKEVGDQAFFTILKTWASQQRDGNVTTDEFIALAEKTSGRQLDELFDAWLFKPVRPES